MPRTYGFRAKIANHYDKCPKRGFLGDKCTKISVRTVTIWHDFSSDQFYRNKYHLTWLVIKSLKNAFLELPSVKITNYITSQIITNHESQIRSLITLDVDIQNYEFMIHTVGELTFETKSLQIHMNSFHISIRFPSCLGLLTKNWRNGKLS